MLKTRTTQTQRPPVVGRSARERLEWAASVLLVASAVKVLSFTSRLSALVRG